jgi:acyl-CoA thioesterase-1
MGIGMAGKNVGRHAQRSLFAIALIVSMAVTAHVAEESPSRAVAPVLSPPCAVPDADIAAPTALPHLAEALRNRHPIRILTIGSSSTVGVGATSNGASYPVQLEKILETAIKDANIEIISRGVTGEVADITADRIMSEVALDKPVLVLWQLGTNDALSRIAPADFETTVRETIRWLKDNDVDVVLVGQQYSPRLARDPSYDAIRTILQRVAADEKVLYVRRYDAMKFITQSRSNVQLMARDNFHLNDLGYRCMAEHVAHAVILSLYDKKTQNNRR